MNPKDFQIDIRSRRCRSLGDLPSIGKIGRVRASAAESAETSGHALLPRDARPAPRPGNAALRKLILHWSIALGAATTVIIAAAISFWILPYLQKRDSAKLFPGFEDAKRVRIASRFPTPREEEALRLVKVAIANRDPAKVGTLFRDGPATAEEVIAFFQDLESRDGAITACEWLSSIDGDGIPLEGVRVRFAGNGHRAERLALLTPDDGGIWKMDFDAFARSVRPSWTELLENHAASATARVVVARDCYFNGPFRDEKSWSCYSITTPDLDVVLHGYCSKGSAEENVMEQLFSDGSAASRATIEISRPDDGERKQFEITRVLAKDWVIPADNLTAGISRIKKAF